MKRKNRWLIVVACIAAGLGAYWWLESSTRPPGETAPQAGLLAPRPNPADAAKLVPQRDVPGETIKAVNQVSAEGAPAEANAAPTVGDILAEADDDYVRVAKKLTAITLNPRAPMEAREEALAHALNLSAGNEAEVLTPLVKDPELPDSLAETILSEALNRPLAYQADLYLAALAARKSPDMQTKIREHLAFLTGGEDKGPNPADWAAPIKAAKASWAQ